MRAVVVALSMFLAAATAVTGAATRTFGRIDGLVLSDYRGTWTTIPTSINDRGDIAGWAVSEDGESAAFVRAAGGRYRTIADAATPTDINNRGAVVGVYLPCGSDACWPEGFVWSGTSGIQSLGSFFPYALNDKGDMAGVCASEQQACVLRDQVVSAVAEPDSEALGINAKGDVVGTYGDNRAFLLTANWAFRDIGRGVANDINDRGVIAGHRWKLLGERGERAVATVWTSRGTRSPAPEVSLGVAINSRGWVIANAWDAHEVPYSFAWNAATGVRLLLEGTEGAYIQVEDVNDRGEVVGTIGTHGAIWRLPRK